jgi:CheY-like chemotaxis protein
MAKIMLVEDDNNLREIYEARLLAEGYEIVSAKDGEEALALAVKEKPDLIISDVMMPKISGFDMLDILRTNPETQNSKVIMMTALSQAEDKARADKLGADRYLVKSQVTLEDVAKVAREVLSGESATSGIPADIAADISAAQQQADSPAPEPAAPAAEPAAPAPVPVTPAPEPITPDPAPVAPAPEPADPIASEPVVTPAADNPVTPPPAPDPTTAAAQDAANLADTVNDMLDTPAAEPIATNASGTTKVIEPINDLSTAKPDLNQLLQQEEAKEAQGNDVGNIIAPNETTTDGNAPTSDPNNSAL